jgi:hypothetical protein
MIRVTTAKENVHSSRTRGTLGVGFVRFDGRVYRVIPRRHEGNNVRIIKMSYELLLEEFHRNAQHAGETYTLDQCKEKLAAMGYTG